MPGSILGNAVHRSEDPRHLRGEAPYLDDLRPEGTLHAVFVRSTVAHATFRVDPGPARGAEGVAGVFTAAELDLPPVGNPRPALVRPRVAVDRVRYVGEPVAVVVADSRARAVDAAEQVLVDYEPLPAVTSVTEALAPDAPLLFPEHGSNVVLERGPDHDADLFADADVVVRGTFVNQRLAPVPLEPNGALAQPDGDGGLTVWASTQSPFRIRADVARSLDLPEEKVRAVAPAVGGGFGAKGPAYPEVSVVAALARRLDRPVLWHETRSENLVVMTHGRDQVQEVELGARRDGTVVAMRARVTGNGGAYAGFGALMPFSTMRMCSGVYRIPRIEYTGVGVVTNTTPTGAYRGAGRPEAAALIERAMDLLADELDLDPAELRRRNFVPPDAFPYTTAVGTPYDSGDYERALDRALELVDYGAVRAEQAERRERGDTRLLGVGISTYVEVSGAGGGEWGSVEVHDDGTVTVRTGTAPHGQGHETTWAQIAASVLRVPFEAVRVLHSDTAEVARGVGTFGSRSAQLGGSAVHRAAEAVVERARDVVANALEAADADVVLFDDGRLGVAGAPARALSWAEVAAAARGLADGDERADGERRADDEDVPRLLREDVDFAQEGGTFPFGAHVAVVEVDAETGHVQLRRMVAVDDCGTVINPLLAEGQVHGGLAQGIGQALFEQVVYDRDGNPLTGTLTDYTVPTATELPYFETAFTETPTDRNPLGAKGIGESGTTGSTPAVQNAVIDALSHLGVGHLDPPLTPERVWRALRGQG